MSSLLEEAFIEAKKLKEAARSQAQTDIIEKYADEIKNSMDSLIEQKEIDLGFMMDEQDEELGFAGPTDDEFDELEGDPMGGDMFDFEDDLEITDTGDTSYLDNQVPQAYSEGEKLCDCPEDEEEIEINFDDLMATADEEEDLMAPPEPMDREMDMDDLSGEEDEDFLEEFEIDDSLFEEFLQEDDLEEIVGRGMSREDVNDVGGVEYDDEDELYEELTADVEETPSGWSPRNDADFDDEFDKLLARLNNPGPKDDDNEDKIKKSHSAAGDPRTKNDVNDRLKENLDKVYRDNKKLVATLTEVRGEIKKIKNFQGNLVKEKRNLEKKASSYKEKLIETADLLQALNLENIKLNLQKKVFENNSLNERQKNALVEAISDAESPEEAKRVYKLQGTVGPRPPRREKSQNPLTEALRNKPTASSVLQTSRRAYENNEAEQDTLQEHAKKRLQMLAGLK